MKTVRELIEALSKVDPDMIVGVIDNEGDICTDIEIERGTVQRYDHDSFGVILNPKRLPKGVQTTPIIVIG